ncbi:ISL3 family transposase [Listeria sp. FSL L7-1582]|uniref:ISL3 family transposase n=1 Tax=Listeria portnoyi TaxID=2713504 RepID=UPI00164E38F1|nr:ISL3 family transposase [Listeria portnoyi]MBC6308231.1 ISL3 family transposase [Listeria portnoyi]
MPDHFIIQLIGLENKNVQLIEHSIEKDTCHIHIQLKRKKHTCPHCQTRTNRMKDYRTHLFQHLKMAEKRVYIHYRKRRYHCPCGKAFDEKNQGIVTRYQRFSIAWHQAALFHSISSASFSYTAKAYGTTASKIIRLFDARMGAFSTPPATLPKIIAIDEFKGDTNKGKFQLIIADPITRRPIDILENRSIKTIQRYLRERGQQVEIVIMDLSPAFKSAVQKALCSPLIIADSFHFSRYIYWALTKVRIRVQQKFHDYDRKRCKRMKGLFYKRKHDLTSEQWTLVQRYLELDSDLQTAYDIKEAYQAWFDTHKAQERTNVRHALHHFYELVRQANIPEFIAAIGTFQRWETEIINAFIYPHLSNGFVEGINNRTKVLKRGAYGFQCFERFRAKILAQHFIKDFDISVG